MKGNRRRGAALPIWVEAMKGWLEGREAEVRTPEPPPGIALMKVDSRSGHLPSAWCEGEPITEAFVEGTEPSEPCPPKSRLPAILSGG